MSKDTTKKDSESAKPRQKGGTHVIRFSKGNAKSDVGASVFLKTAGSGFKYLAFSLSRGFKSSESPDEKKRYSTDFYDYNAAAIADVAIQAASFIQAHRDNPEGAIEAAEEIKAKRTAKVNGATEEASEPTAPVAA